MKRLWWMLAVAVATAGCAAEASNEEGDQVAPSETSELGGLSLALTSVDSQGRIYHLRDATFTISPAYYYGDGGVQPDTVLSTEDDPTADQLTVRLVPAYYRVTLGGDWYIERLTSTGPERVQQVVLLTDTTQFTYVNQDWNNELHFQFGVDGTYIDFRHGDLSIDIGIELPGDRPADAGPLYPYPTYDSGTPIRRDGGVALIE